MIDITYRSAFSGKLFHGKGLTTVKHIPPYVLSYGYSPWDPSHHNQCTVSSFGSAKQQPLRNSCHPEKRTTFWVSWQGWLVGSSVNLATKTAEAATTDGKHQRQPIVSPLELTHQGSFPGIRSSHTSTVSELIYTIRIEAIMSYLRNVTIWKEIAPYEKNIQTNKHSLCHRLYQPVWISYNHTIANLISDQIYKRREFTRRLTLRKISWH